MDSATMSNDQHQTNDGASSIGGASTQESSSRTRGPSHGKFINDNGKKILIMTNALGVPNIKCEETTNFTTTLGVITRTNIPIIYKSWPEVPETYKKKVVDVVSSNYEFDGLDGINEGYVRRKANELWKTYKHNLRAKYIDKKDPKEVSDSVAPDAVPLEDWRSFVAYTYSEEFKNKKAKNKANREKQKGSSQLGRTSMPILRHLIAVENNLESDFDVCRGDVYVKFHTKKDGTVLVPEVAAKLKDIESLDPNTRLLSEDDSLAKAIGKDSRGRMRGFDGSISRRLLKKAKPMLKKAETLRQEKATQSDEIATLKKNYESLFKMVETLSAKMNNAQPATVGVEIPRASTSPSRASLPNEDLIKKHCVLLTTSGAKKKLLRE